ncbi:MAG: choice-of-anchor D domain-containing protein [Ferruginibacter sp.]
MRKIFTLLLVLSSVFSFSQSTTLVISQVYGAGGNTGASLNADYVELHNISGSVQSLSGLTLQYSSATNTGTWTGVTPMPAATIPAGGYYLVQMGGPGAAGVALPTPDLLANPTIALSGTNGKVALVNSATALSGCPAPGTVIDLVGYGTANCFEGSAGTAVLTVTNAAFRNNNGCAETDNNGADFTVAAAAPRNSASPVFICSGGPPSPSLTAGTVVDFGNVVVSTNSPSQNFNLSGSNLTGAPGTITITSPSADFQVSNDNSVWGVSTTIPYTSATLAATPVYVRFTPQTVGPKSGNVNIIGGGVTTAVTVAVSGNGVLPAGPTVTSSPTDVPTFGAVCLNTTAGPNSVTLTGSNLTVADLVITSSSPEYTFSTTAGGTYTASLTLVHPAGAYTQDIFVNFTPTTPGAHDADITVAGGGQTTAAIIHATGSGDAGLATVITGSPSAITQNSATLAGSLPAQGCTPVTLWGFEYSTVSPVTGAGILAYSASLSGIDFTAGLAGLLPGTTYYYRAFAINSADTAFGVEMSFITSAPPPATLSATALSGFGATCVNTTVGPNAFDITGTNLTAADITIGPLNGYTFSTSLAGTYTNSLTITQTGGAYTQTIYVKFTPASLGNYNGNIPVAGGGVASYSVPVTGTASEVAPVVVTGDASLITANGATLAGSVTSAGGCSAVFASGIEYSGISGFVDGSGIKVSAINPGAADISSVLTGLVQGTTYYYKAYAVTNGGTTYGLQNSFTTLSIPDGLVIYSVPIIHGQNLHFSLKGIKQGHYSARIHNSIGQLVYQKDFIVQVNFMDNTFIVPGNFPIGLYNLEIRNHEYKIQKSFMIQ